MSNTQTGIRAIPENSALTTRRSSKLFARNAVDITLEHTVNADAASRSTGIAAFSRSEEDGRSVRSAIIGNL